MTLACFLPPDEEAAETAYRDLESIVDTIEDQDIKRQMMQYIAPHAPSVNRIS